MNLIGIENITQYKDVFEFKIYKYDDEINLGDNDSFICNLKIVLTRVDDVYADRFDNKVEALALVKDLNSNIEEILVEEIKEFILEEVWEDNLGKENIDVMFIKS